MTETKHTAAQDEAVWDDLPPITAPACGIDEQPARRWERLLYAWQHTLVDISPFVLQVGLRNVFGGVVTRGAIFFAIWFVGLGVAGVLGAVDWGLVAGKPWFAPPALLPYGGPGLGWTFVPAAILGVLAGYLGSMVESLGDYAATCAVAMPRAVLGGVFVVVCGMIALAGVRLLAMARSTPAK